MPSSPLPEALTLVYDVGGGCPRDVPLGDVYADLAVTIPHGRPAVIVNMVQTLDGVVALDGKAWGLGSEVDHYLFRTLRGWADAVLSGAGTLRTNDIVATTHAHLQTIRAAAGRPANPTAVVISRRAEFSDSTLRKRFFARRDFTSLVVTTELAREADRRRIEDAGAEVLIVPAGPEGDGDLTAALGLLASRGVRRVLCEGGPATNRRLMEAGLVDEIFVTVTPRVAGAGGAGRVLAGLLGGAPAGLSIVSELQHRSPALREWYLRCRVAREGMAGDAREPR